MEFNLLMEQVQEVVGTVFIDNQFYAINCSRWTVAVPEKKVVYQLPTHQHMKMGYRVNLVSWRI